MVSGAQTGGEGCKTEKAQSIANGNTTCNPRIDPTPENGFDLARA